MKKLIYIFVLISAALLTSCLKDDKDIFEDSAANRTQAKLDEVNTLLKESGNGWLMEYYPGKNQEYGGFNLLMRFTNHDSVFIASEITDPDAVAISLYQMIPDAGPVLTFNTYNEILHFFSDPENPSSIGERGEGMEGDYEFIVQEVSSQEITFKGKKTHNTIVMSPMPNDLIWEDYLQQVAEANALLSGIPSFQLYVGDKAVKTTVNTSMTAFHFSIVEGKTDTEIDAPFIVKPEGIKFYQTIEVAGKKMQNFTFAEDGSGLTSTDDPTVKILYVYPPINQIFAETTTQWFFDNTTFSSTVEAGWNAIAAAVLNGEGEILQLGYLGYSHATKKAPCIGLGTDAYWAILGADFTPVAETEDELAIAFNSFDILNWSFYEGYYRPFLDILETNSPYKLVPDDTHAPTKITFTSTKNANVTFTLEK